MVQTTILHRIRNIGSQNLFICKKLVRTHNQKIIPVNFSLTISGFNELQNYSSKLIEVPLKLGNEIRRVNDLAIKEINLSKIRKVG